MRWRLRSLVLIAGLTACKSASAREQDKLERSVSWLSTVQEVGRAWSENRVPARYAERTFDEAQSELTRAGEVEAARRVTDVAEVLRRRDRARLPNALDLLAGPRDGLQNRLEAMKRAP